MSWKKKFSNSRKDRRVMELAVTDLESESNNLTLRCKFNFSYIDGTQDAAPGLIDISDEELRMLVVFLKEMSANSLRHWLVEKRYVEYDHFPPRAKTEYIHPPHVPVQARWGRFRITGAYRLCGFTVPGELDGERHPVTGMLYDKNTFYIVFLDIAHQFWKTER